MPGPGAGDSADSRVRAPRAWLWWVWCKRFTLTLGKGCKTTQSCPQVQHGSTGDPREIPRHWRCSEQLFLCLGILTSDPAMPLLCTCQHGSSVWFSSTSQASLHKFFPLVTHICASLPYRPWVLLTGVPGVPSQGRLCHSQTPSVTRSRSVTRPLPCQDDPWGLSSMRSSVATPKL